jgi:hypothetical protein
LPAKRIERSADTDDTSAAPRQAARSAATAHPRVPQLVFIRSSEHVLEFLGDQRRIIDDFSSPVRVFANRRLPKPTASDKALQTPRARSAA